MDDSTASERIRTIVKELVTIYRETLEDVNPGKISFSKAYFYESDGVSRVTELCGYHSDKHNGFFEINDMECEFDVLKDDSMPTIKKYLNERYAVSPKAMSSLVNRAHYEHVRMNGAEFVYFREIGPKHTFEDDIIEEEHEKLHERLPFLEVIGVLSKTGNERSLSDARELSERGFRNVGFSYWDSISSFRTQYATYSRPHWDKMFFDFHNSQRNTMDEPLKELKELLPQYNTEVSSNILYGDWSFLSDKYELLKDVPLLQRKTK